MLPNHFLERQIERAIESVIPEVQPGAVLVRPCPNPKFGDYQCTAIMALAKERRLNPRHLAGQVTEALDRQMLEAPPDPSVRTTWQIAGPGFLNFRMTEEALAGQLELAWRGKHLFFQATERPRTIIVDFSSPNVAKPMHIGHIRSTILGDCLARTMRLLGHRVVTDNHIGDWGTQFGKLIVGWKRHLKPVALERDPLDELERLYRTVNAACEEQPTLLEEARAELVKLQNGDDENLALWKSMIRLSKGQFDAIYGRLGVRFDQTLGESFYNPRLKPIVEELVRAGLARESEGAIAVFFEDRDDLKDHPALIRKSDGAANYTTTDLATLAYRLETWQPDEIIYVTDGRQQLHFRQVFEVFRRWQPESRVRLAHVWFGSILGEGGRPYKTRSGDTIRLAALLDEAEERAFQIVTEKNPGLPELERREVARIVGIGAVKYADLLPNRQSDYVFNWDKMLSFNGNTAPYLQYAYTRIQSIFRKAEVTGLGQDQGDQGFELSTEQERVLAKHLLNFGSVLEAVTEEYRPNYLCNYLYELAGYFARFYENCPVLKAVQPSARSTRLALCGLTGRVLKTGLNTLGIETTERM